MVMRNCLNSRLSRSRSNLLIRLYFLLALTIYIAICVNYVSRLSGRTVISSDDRFSLTCEVSGSIQEGETLSEALILSGLPYKDAFEIVSALSNLLDMRSLRPGDRFFARFSHNGKVKEFRYERHPWNGFNVKRVGDTYIARRDSVPLGKCLRFLKGEVKNTLWESMINQKIPPVLVAKLSDVFSYDIDFLTETRNGQKFKVLYEEYLYKNKPVRIGNIVAAEYITENRAFWAFYYEDPSGKKGYYNSNGQALKRTLLRSPLNYSRISSYFSHRRLHPIFKVYRPHLGVDLAAPEGTPVVAAGSGKVIFAGWKKGFGNYIEISHNRGKIVTCYGHLSRFARGIKRGKRVNQGQVIGFVGHTGYATGPHLDYRIRINGKNVNPLKYVAPPGPPIPRKYRDDFATKTRLAKMLFDEVI